MNQLRILIAEDEPIIAMILGDLLTELGHIICATVTTEQEAVALADAERPDFIIIDAGLGTGNGIAAMAAISARRPTPHVYVTGNADAVRAVEPNAVVLEKPFQEPELIAAIERALATPTASVST